ncbi:MULTISPECIES: gas vesicle structural protein GvpA [Streptomyces]|uniref:Gas vesicle protein A n=1 Tax=Streptomyces virginiae TaxID=1961 RepID=A0ABQ3NLU1_STRVG|nr:MULTISPECIES: gas vesicle structural protein GvpA [Streptomyces]KOU15367.1 gas vesicle protein [Streptomyces sp. WM6349]KOU80638.1 gas vesicle protein [Streptomyces sp. XY593]KOU99707.1 gas vesicle protein [Streptomyces sp. XY533]KOV10584.1 gas vesicle protein [Streptomyces sp. XY511]KOV42238.1 gas vesicle protein [Streptomyces sp. H036]
MTVMPQGASSVSRGGGGGGGTSSLYDVLELILDRGLVIDVFVRVSLVGIEILKIDARIVVASVDTYLRFAEACNRLDLEAGRKAPAQLTDVVGNMVESGAHGKSKGALSGAVDAVTQSLTGKSGASEKEDEPEEEPEEEEAPRRRRPARRPVRRERE